MNEFKTFYAKLFITKEMGRLEALSRHMLLSGDNDAEIVSRSIDKMQEILGGALKLLDSNLVAVAQVLGNYLAFSEEYNIHTEEGYSIELAIDKVLERLS